MATKPALLEIQSIKVDDLLLDPENPRLVGVVGPNAGQPELIKAMWREMSVSEVALSIAENGFFEEEPLFAIPATEKPGKYYVVEGNRRLTAVKLLTDANLRAEVKATDLPRISAKAAKDLHELPVSLYSRRRDLWEYFGFRHVNGPKEWDSLSKAHYVARVRREYGISLEEITKKIGDQHSTVVRIYRGYVLLEQAEQMTDFRRDDITRNRFYFSHLYTAADYEQVQDFLGTDPDHSLKDNPIQKKFLPNLEQLMLWLFGSKERRIEPVVRTQSPDLNYLRAVIGNKTALAALRSGISLHRAHAISLGDARRFEDSLAQAKDNLQEAKATVTTGYRGDRELLLRMEDVQSLVMSILEEMRKKIAKKAI